MSYIKVVKKHLTDYKTKTLGIKEPGIFKHQGTYHELGHILPAKLGGFLNIMESYRVDFFGSKFADIKFHQFFHHLNSSQALCINLFYPLIKEMQLGTILDQLNLRRQGISVSEFEKESDLETDNEGKQRRKTNFDFFMQLADGTKIYFEIKYTEDGFGKVDSSKYDNRDKFTAVYEDMLNHQFIKPEFHNCDAFLTRYQIMRNLCHITDNSYVVFVYPKANKKIHEQVAMAKKDILTEEGNKRFRVLSLESLLPSIRETLPSSIRMEKHYKEFEEKYGF